MLFTDIRLQNYRSYKDASFELGPGVNIIVGPNGAGKTNLLEALMVNAVGKSYRARDPLLVKNGFDWARIDIHTADNISRTTKLQYDQNARLQKTFQIDDHNYSRLPHRLKQPVVLFEPESLRLLHCEPGVRRDYVDDTIEQLSAGYPTIRAKYRRTLSQRNSLLKQGAQAESQLFVWDLRLSELAEQVVSARNEFLGSINKSITNIYKAISKEHKDLSLRYHTAVEGSAYGTALLKKLEASKELDMARGFTGNGPHRDDFVFYFGVHPAAESASRGEIRTLLLALKIVEMQLLEAEKGTKPLLLLDDVFSELDGARRRALTDFLADHQTIITTTDADIVLKSFARKSTVIPLG